MPPLPTPRGLGWVLSTYHLRSWGLFTPRGCIKPHQDVWWKQLVRIYTWIPWIVFIEKGFLSWSAWFFYSLWIVFWNDSQRFGFSTRSLEAETLWIVSKHDPKWVKQSFTSIWILDDGSNNTFSNVFRLVFLNCAIQNWNLCAHVVVYFSYGLHPCWYK